MRAVCRALRACVVRLNLTVGRVRLDITDNIIALGYPAEKRIEAAYRNDISTPSHPPHPTSHRTTHLVSCRVVCRACRVA